LGRFWGAAGFFPVRVYRFFFRGQEPRDRPEEVFSADWSGGKQAVDAFDQPFVFLRQALRGPSDIWRVP
jgi:hypothetical protein